MRQMYAKYSGVVHFNQCKDDRGWVAPKLKVHHHVRLDLEFKKDFEVWYQFLSDPKMERIVNRPMVDLTEQLTVEDILFFSDATVAENLGFGCILDSKWIYGSWEPGFIERYNPSIEYLELFGLCAGLLTWADQPILNDCRVVVFCDNQPVVSMINDISSSCPNCMILIRIIVLNGLLHNRRVFAKYVTTKNNFLADVLSRLQLSRFRKLGPHMNEFPDKIHPQVWPITKVWRNVCK